MSRFGDEWDEFINGLEDTSAPNGQQGFSSSTNNQPSSGQQPRRGFVSQRLNMFKNKPTASVHNSTDGQLSGGDDQAIRYVLAPDISSDGSVEQRSTQPSQLQPSGVHQLQQQGVEVPQSQGMPHGSIPLQQGAQSEKRIAPGGITQGQIAAMMRPKADPAQVGSSSTAVNPNNQTAGSADPQQKDFKFTQKDKSSSPFARKRGNVLENSEDPFGFGGASGSSIRTPKTNSQISKASEGQTVPSDQDLFAAMDKSSRKGGKGLRFFQRKKRREKPADQGLFPDQMTKESTGTSVHSSLEQRQNSQSFNVAQPMSSAVAFPDSEPFEQQTKKGDKDYFIPSMAEVESELQVIAYRKRYLQLLRNTLAVLLVAAAAAALVATIWMPVLQIYGKSMYPTLEEGEIVISFKAPDLQTGDPVAFYYNNKLLIKRVIASPGQIVDIDSKGDVYVDGKLIDEPYLNEKSFEPCDIELPYQVPDQRWFVLGDNRSVSVDSRDSSIGCIPKEYIVGRVEFCVWPLNKFGWV